MKSVKNILSIVFALVLFPIIVPASDLPSLKPSSNIVTGELGNGIKYYIAVNSAEKGKADIALVQQVGYADETPSTAAETIIRSRESLTGLPRFTTASPLRFLSGSGIWPSKDGYVNVDKDATIYNFRNIDLPTNTNAVDSTLLLIFDIIGSSAGPMEGLYAPSRQAIIVSGDVDAKAVIGKMDMLSLLVPGKFATRRPSRTPNAYDNLLLPPPSRETASLSVVYNASRTNREDMATILPLVTGKMAEELGIILRRRLTDALKNKGIPVAAISFVYTGSDETPDEELYTLTVTTSAGRLRDATAVVAEVLADIDMNGVGAAEYKAAQAQYLTDIKMRATTIPSTNAGLVDRCVSSFLYGSSLADDKEAAEFFRNRNIDDETSVHLFNNFAKAIIDRVGNMHLETRANDFEGQLVPKIFDSAWTAVTTGRGKGGKPSEEFSDMSMKKFLHKAKVKADNTEPLSGGRMWTFDNGIKVIFKKVSGTGDLFYYTWLLKGGYSSIRGLKAGEGAYISDMLWCSSFDGVSADKFRNTLKSNGIELRPTVTVSDFRIAGVAPESNLDMLMKSLNMIAYERDSDANAYKNYRDGENLRLSLAGKDRDWHRAVLDSIMSPGSVHSSYKRADVMSDDLQRKADGYFTRQFAKMNDGVLIIVGDFSEETLKKTLSQYLGGFRTENVASYRTTTKYETVAGRRTVYGEDMTPGLDISFSTPANYTAENLLASSIAAFELQKTVAAAAALDGWYVESEQDFEMFPEERFHVNMYLRPSDSRGLPGSMVVNDSVDKVLSNINAAVDNLADKGISGSTLSGMKKMLSNSVSSWNSDPVMIINMLVLRYSYGKDLMTRQTEKVNGVTETRVNALLRGLCGGSVAEYAVRGRISADDITEAVIREPDRLYVPPVHPYSDTTGFATLYYELLAD